LRIVLDLGLSPQQLVVPRQQVRSRRIFIIFVSSTTNSFFICIRGSSRAHRALADCIISFVARASNNIIEARHNSKVSTGLYAEFDKDERCK